MQELVAMIFLGSNHFVFLYTKYDTNQFDEFFGSAISVVSDMWKTIFLYNPVVWMVLGFCS